MSAARIILFFVLISVTFRSVDARAQQPRAEAAAKLLVTLCVAGGSITITKSTTAQEKYRVGGIDHTVLIEKRDISGLVDGINNAMDNLTVSQANKARECMQPYIGRLMTLELGDDEDKQIVRVKRVTGDVEWNAAPSDSKFDWIASYSYIYKNFGRSRATCRFIATGALKKKKNDETYKRFEKSVDDFSVASGATYEVIGDVGVIGFNDSNYVVSMTSDIDCW